MNKYLSLVLIASLAACGGGGGEGDSSTDPIVDPDTSGDTNGEDGGGDAGGDAGDDTGGDAGGDTGGDDTVVDPNPDEPDADVDDGESSIRDATVVETSGGRYELTNDTAGFIAGETVYRINVARGPNRNGVGGFGTALQYDGNNVTVFAGTDVGQQPNFAAIGDDTVDAPTGNATYTGHYSVADDPEVDALATADENGTLTLNFNLGASTVTGTSDNGVFVVNADVVNGGELEGSVTVDGSSADIVTGGFYGANADEVAGGFTNDDFGGYFYGD